MSPLPPTDTSSLLSRLPGVSAATLEVAGRTTISPVLVEVTLSGQVGPLSPAPGNDLMVAVPVDGGDGSFRRDTPSARLTRVPGRSRSGSTPAPADQERPGRRSRPSAPRSRSWGPEAR